ncbi:hypothetical protein NM688_g2939 [Phlebia brevispora]|uniref:Uncharacterized protein n=1 Tax=Phlebia brevispora TaxID=194682 RepID=A0ACC1T6X1_9APHY|nr:hypothetical protein NM688_g2939 [Phlebia brevispora]
MRLAPDSSLSLSPTTSIICTFVLGSSLVHHTNTQGDDGKDEEDMYWLSAEVGDDEDDEQKAEFKEGNDPEGGDGDEEKDYVEELYRTRAR